VHAVQKPSDSLFVVHTKQDRAEARDRLREIGEVETLKGSDNLMLMHTRRETSDAKAAWELIRSELEDEEVVYPVLIDEGGRHQYPTGEISVRFRSTPTDAQLERFAASHGLRLQSRNEFMPQQAIFEPVNPGDRYIPELVQEVADAKNVQLAWANTLSRYEHA
jgi:hypothetical protein